MQPPEPDDEPRRLADHLFEYVREPMLWPVLLVAVGIFVTLGTRRRSSGWCFSAGC